LGAKIWYEGAWNGGRVHVEATTLSELDKIVQELRQNGTGHANVETPLNFSSNTLNGYPQLSADLGCTGAIISILGSDYGKAEPRTEAELTEVMKASAIHYPHGTISGVLTSLTKRKKIRRVGKKNGSYAYTLNASNEKNPEYQDR
jgi:hypothetical protein